MCYFLPMLVAAPTAAIYLGPETQQVYRSTMYFITPQSVRGTTVCLSWQFQAKENLLISLSKHLIHASSSDRVLYDGRHLKTSSWHKVSFTLDVPTETMYLGIQTFNTQPLSFGDTQAAFRKFTYTLNPCWNEGRAT